MDKSASISGYFEAKIKYWAIGVWYCTIMVSCIMWQSSLAACGHVGVATRAGGVLFVTRRGVRVPAIVS